MKTIQLMVVKRYVPVFGPPLLIVAAFFLLLRPAYLSLNRIKKEISAKNKDLQESRAIVASKKEIFAVFQEVQKKDAFYRVYFSPLEETDILRRMAKIANRANILYTKLAPLSQPQTATPAPNTQGQAPSATFDIRPFVFTFKASYTQFSEVLTQLAKLDRFVTVRSFKIDTKEDKVNPQPYNPTAELTIDFYSRPGPPASSVQGQAPAPAIKVQTPKAVSPPAPQKTTPVYNTQGQAPASPAKTEPKKAASAVQPAGTRYYTVCPGDNLIKIAHRYGMNVWELRKMNNMPKESLIRPGDKIIVK